MSGGRRGRTRGRPGSSSVGRGNRVDSIQAGAGWAGSEREGVHLAPRAGSPGPARTRRCLLGPDRLRKVINLAHVGQVVEAVRGSRWGRSPQGAALSGPRPRWPPLRRPPSARHEPPSFAGEWAKHPAAIGPSRANLVPFSPKPLERGSPRAPRIRAVRCEIPAPTHPLRSTLAQVSLLS
jgi:hypothetical protein